MPDGRSLVAQMDGLLAQFLVWDLVTGHMVDVWREPIDSFGELALTETLGRFDYTYAAFALSPLGNHFATATANGEVVLWDTATLEKQTVKPREEELGRINVRGMAFSDDGAILIYYDRLTDQTHFWDVAAQSAIGAIDIGSEFFALSPDKNLLALASRESASFVHLSQPDNPIQLVTFPDDLIAASPVLAFSPDSKRLVIGGFGLRGDDMTADSILYVVTFE